MKIPYNATDGKLDAPGVAALGLIFQRCGLMTKYYPDGKFGIDLGIYIGEERILDADAEVRLIWKSEAFPKECSPVHIPYRKGARTYKRPTFFATISADFRRAMLIEHGKLVKVQPVSNRRSENQLEPFYGFFLKDTDRYYKFNLDKPDLMGPEMERLLGSIGVYI